MHRRAILSCVFLGAFLQLTADAGAQAKPAAGPRPKKASEIYVIAKARLYEVDAATYEKLAKAKWLSKADLEELETRPGKPLALFAKLEKQKPALVGKEINVEHGKKGVLLAATRPSNYLPTPDQLRQGKKGRQTVSESITLNVELQISADRRFVRARFLEKSQVIEGVEKARVLVDDKGTEAVGELVSVKEASISQTRNIPDGGSILLPVQYRPYGVRKNDRWLVAEITPRIYIEAEERVRRGQAPK